MTLNCYVDGKSDYSNRECARKDGHNPRKLQSIHYSLMGKRPNLVWRTVRSVPCLPLLALLYASCCGSLKGQTRPSEIRFQAGTATFFEAPQHVTLGGAYRKYFGRTGWGIEPEFSWMTEGNIWIIFLPSILLKISLSRLRANLVHGHGRGSHQENTSSKVGISALGWGVGVKIRTGGSSFVAPQIRIGYEPTIRLSVFFGFDARRHSQ